MALNKINFAPIALFAFNRLEHTRNALKSLSTNPEFIFSPLIIFSDGPRNDKDIQGVTKTRNFLHSFEHPNKRIIESRSNIGLANSIINGVTKLCDEYGRIIVLEDDLVVSNSFLHFMNQALKNYEFDSRVISIHGYSFPISNLPDTFFLRATGSWGWATWKSGWDLFEPDGRILYLMLEKKGAFKAFNFNNSFNYKKMLLDQIKGKNDSWAVRFYASAFLNNKLTLHPGKSFVFNNGFDSSGSHCWSINRFDSNISNKKLTIRNIKITENFEVRKAWETFLNNSKINIYSRIKFKIKRLIKKFYE